MITKAKRRAGASLPEQPTLIAGAIANLKAARDTLRTCGCKNAADYVARAMKSAEGAHRHALRMQMQAYHAARHEEDQLDVERVLVQR
jgi:hypothetical protein